jgi:hypothetical protein
VLIAGRQETQQFAELSEHRYSSNAANTVYVVGYVELDIEASGQQLGRALSAGTRLEPDESGDGYRALVDPVQN